jgi:polyhydroxybutyrate depolymerase
MNKFVTPFFMAIAASAVTIGCGHSNSNINPSASLFNEDVEPSLALRGSCQMTSAKNVPSGFSDQCISVKGEQRHYRVYRPSKLNGNQRPSALVIVLHGGGGSGTSASDPNKNALGVMNSVADRDGFVAIYPDATLDSSGRPGWNDCRSDDKLKSGADDVGFLAELVKQNQDNFKIDRSKVFMSGTSNGAMMTYRFAMERSEMLGGIATSSGNIAKHPTAGRCKAGPLNPLPILMTHGSQDPVVPSEGGFVACFGRSNKKCDRGEVLSISDTIQFWLKANRLENINPITRVVDESKEDGGSAVESTYTRLSGVMDSSNINLDAFRGAKVVAWTLNGAGHPPPSKSLDKGNRIVGKQNRDIEFAEVAWAFFKSL